MTTYKVTCEVYQQPEIMEIEVEADNDFDARQEAEDKIWEQHRWMWKIDIEDVHEV